MLSKLFVLIGQQKEPAEGATRRENEDQCREYALDTASVELDETEAALSKLLQNQVRNQKSGNDKKNIDAQEAAFNPRWKAMKANNRQDGNRTKAINIGAPVRGRAGLIRAR